MASWAVVAVMIVTTGFLGIALSASDMPLDRKKPDAPPLVHEGSKESVTSLGVIRRHMP